MTFDPSRPVYIVGGGASLADFDWTLLAGKQCIAINTAYRKVPTADILLFSDVSFYDQHAASFWRFKGKRIVCTWPPLKDAPGVEYVDPASLSAAALHCNSGVRAILLAHHLGAGRIILLGFDNVPGYWHDETHLAHNSKVDPGYYPVYADQMAQVAKLGFDIVNANEHSGLTCFPVIPRDTAF